MLNLPFLMYLYLAFSGLIIFYVVYKTTDDPNTPDQNLEDCND